MANIVWTCGTETFTWLGGQKYPVAEPARVNVVVDYSAGRQIYAYDKGVQEQAFALDFELVPTADHDNFARWLTVVAVGPKNAFTHRDESGVDHTVRLIDTVDPFVEVSPGAWSGRVMLREEVS